MSDFFFVGQSLVGLSGTALKGPRHCLPLQERTDGENISQKQNGPESSGRAWRVCPGSAASARTHTVPLKAALSTKAVSRASAVAELAC